MILLFSLRVVHFCFWCFFVVVTVCSSFHYIVFYALLFFVHNIQLYNCSWRSVVFVSLFSTTHIYYYHHRMPYDLHTMLNVLYQKNTGNTVYFLSWFLKNRLRFRFGSVFISRLFCSMSSDIVIYILYMHTYYIQYSHARSDRWRHPNKCVAYIFIDNFVVDDVMHHLNHCIQNHCTRKKYEKL